MRLVPFFVKLSCYFSCKWEQRQARLTMPTPNTSKKQLLNEANRLSTSLCNEWFRVSVGKISLKGSRRTVTAYTWKWKPLPEQCRIKKASLGSNEQLVPKLVVWVSDWSLPVETLDSILRERSAKAMTRKRGGGAATLKNSIILFCRTDLLLMLAIRHWLYRARIYSLFQTGHRRCGR